MYQHELAAYFMMHKVNAFIHLAFNFYWIILA